MIWQHGLGVMVLFLAAGGASAGGPGIVITEWMYSGSTAGGGEFIELTNVGQAPIDMTGWSFDDSGRQPGAFDLSAFGVVEPGRSVIITEDPAGDFRMEWGLHPFVRVIGELGVNSGSNLGRNDEINIYDASGVLVDRLTYGDEDFPGTIRTQRVSGNPVVAAALGANDVYKWALASVDDAQGSWANASGDVGSPGSFEMPTGGAIPGPVAVSRPSGFYTGPVQVELKSDGATIYYTTDGSIPTLQSNMYTGPIVIDDRTPEPNYFSHIQSAPNEGWALPAGNIFKATAFRAAAINAEGVSGPVTTRTYIVHPDGAERFTMPVISVITDEPNFYDYFRGIYVPGYIYDKFYNPDIVYWNREANYTQRGDDWERPARFEFFEPDGTPGPSLDVGVRIHGGVSRSSRRKSLRIYARSEYGQSWIEYPIFPGEDVQQFKRLLLRNGGNDGGRTIFRDAFIQDLVKDTGIATQWQRPAIVLVNGEYWGVHNIRQRYDKYFFQAMYGADPDNIDYLSGPNSDPEEGDKQQFIETIVYVYNNDMSDPDLYNHVLSLIDMEDFITYTAVQLFIANTDWPQNNIEHWRERKPGSRWRWLLYDTDLSFNASGSQSPSMDAVNRILTTTTRHARLVQSLKNNPDFFADFLNRSADLMNKELSVANMTQRLEAFRQTFAPEMDEHIHRWRYPASVSAWNSAITVMQNFINARANYHRVHLANGFGVPGTATLTLQNAHPERGTIRVSTIDLPADTTSWTGVYFRTVPVPITGQPAPGYRFAGFTELPDAPVDGRVTWVPEGNQTLTARFVCLADFDGNDAINFFDFAAYLAAFTSNDPAADLAAPFGTLNFFDVAAFVGLFEAGCP